MITTARPAIPALLAAILLGASLLSVALLLAGCKREENRPTYQTEVNRAKAVRQAERKRQQAQQDADSRESAAQAAAANNAPRAAPTAAPTYMPPSEDGADVQMTETPLDGSSPAPPNSAGTNTTPDSQSVTQQAASSGGQMPSGAMATPAAGGLRPGANPPGGTGMSAPAVAPGTAALSATAARTDAEQTNALNQELQRQLREFDALMRKAHENAALERAAIAARGGSPDSDLMRGNGGGLQEPPEGIGAGGAANRTTGLGNTPDQSGEAPVGARPPPLSGRAEANLPDGADDDIVSRQLREAAERETDPVLRDKLWEEYRKYKGGL